MGQQLAQCFDNQVAIFADSSNNRSSVESNHTHQTFLLPSSSNNKFNEIFSSEDDSSSTLNMIISDQNNPLFVFDILSEVFSYLDNCTIYLKCSLTCKTWRYCAWHLLDEFNFRYDDQLDVLFYGGIKRGEEMAEKLNPSLRKTDAIRMNNNQMLEYMLNLIVRNAKYLKKFNVVGAQQSEEIKEMISDERMIMLMKSCSECLEALDLSSCDKLTEVSYMEILKKCQNSLKSLKMRYNFSIRDTYAKEYISKLEALEYLNLSKCFYIGHYSLIPISIGCKKLRVLDLSGCRSFVGFSFLQDCKSLEELHVQDTTFSDNDLQYLPISLKILDLKNCSELKDSPHVERLQNIEEIDLSYNLMRSCEHFCKYIMKWKSLKVIGTPISMQIIQQAPYLEYLEIGFVTELDTLSQILQTQFNSDLSTDSELRYKLSHLNHLLITDSHLTDTFINQLYIYCPNIKLKTKRCNPTSYTA